MLMVFFYTPWKHQKIRDFLMFLGSIERNRVLKWVNHIVLSAMTTVEDLGVDKILSWITINRISFNGQFWCWPNPNLRKKEISHTCEESGAHPRISVWHLLMNLKNNYLLKKLLKWANKEMWISISSIQKNTWRYHYFTPCVSKILIIWSTVLEIYCDRTKLVIIGHFFPFYPTNDPKN